MRGESIDLVAILVDVDASLALVPIGRCIDNTLWRYSHRPHGVRHVGRDSGTGVTHPDLRVTHLSGADRRAYQHNENPGDD